MDRASGLPVYYFSHSRSVTALRMSKKIPPAQKPKTELFSPEEVESVVPELERARRAAEASAKKAKAPSASAPFTEHRYAEATR